MLRRGTARQALVGSSPRSMAFQRSSGRSGSTVCGLRRGARGAVTLVAAGHRGPLAAVAQREQPREQQQGAAHGRDVRPGGVREDVHGGRGVAGGLRGLVVQRGAVGGAGQGGGDGARAAQREQSGHREAARAADGEHGDERGEAHDGQRRGHARDVAALGGQGERAAGHRRGALRPLLPGGEQGDGGAERAAQQGDGKAAPAGPGGSCGCGTGVRNGCHVLHYHPNPGRTGTRGSDWPA